MNSTTDPSIDESEDDAHGDRYGWDATGKHGDGIDDYEGDE